MGLDVLWNFLTTPILDKSWNYRRIGPKYRILLEPIYVNL